MIIGVLDNLINSILEVVDVSLVIANLVSVGRDCLSNQSLSNTQVLNHETKRSVNRVVLVQLLVKRASSGSETVNLKFFWRDVLPEIANFLIEHELELFKLLGLLLQVKDVFLPLMDNLVLNVDLRLLFRPLNLKLLDVGPLLLEHRVLILDPTIKGLKLLTHISKLVLGELDLTL